MRLWFLLIAALSFAGCVKNSVPENAAVDIFYKGMPVGKGVFVSVRDESSKQRTFFITARHVATFPKLVDSDIPMCIRETGKFVLHSARDRWMTAEKKYDLAWIELNQKECLNIERLTEYAPIPMESVARYDQLLINYRAKTVDAALLFSGEPAYGTFVCQDLICAPMPFDYNRTLRVADIDIIPVRAREIIVKGDSGAPTFAKVGGLFKKEWKLLGLVIGGNSINRINAVQPLDILAAKLVHSGGIHLSDHMELW